MTTFAIGDVQGCYQSLQKLLKKVKFNPDKDRLWFAGDLINRGPESLRTLQFIRSLGKSALTVLGNHDLHALAIYYGEMPAKSKDTLQTLFSAADAPKLFAWLRKQSLAHYDKERKILLTHAGIPPSWEISQAMAYAKEVESKIQSEQAAKFFSRMYGNRPDSWDPELKGYERLRVITNHFTRMRFIDKHGRLDLKAKQGIDSAPKGFDAWFNYSRPDKVTILFGHWAAIKGVTGKKRFIALDTGCVWGWRLRAYDVDNKKIYEVAASE